MNCPKCFKEFKGVDLCTEEKCFFDYEREAIDEINIWDGEVKFPKREAIEYDPIIHKKKRKPMKNVINWIKGLVTGESKAGQLVYGVLNVLPIPEEAIAGIFKALFSGEKEKAKAEAKELANIKIIVPVVASVAYFAGWITLEDLQKFIEWFTSIL